MRAVTNTHEMGARVAGTRALSGRGKAQRFEPTQPKAEDRTVRLHLPSLEGDVVDQVLVHLDSMDHEATAGQYLQRRLHITTGAVEELSLAS
jgi:hypothetical protein